MTIIMRSALVYWGRSDVPANLHHIEDDGLHGRRVVTWDDVMAARREEQARLLQFKRRVREWLPTRIVVEYFDQFLMGGWQAMIENRVHRAWIDRDRPFLIPALMTLFPVVPPSLFDDRDPQRSDEWHRWKIAFARTHRRGTHDRRPRGFGVVFWDGGSQIRGGAR